jgi:hypothetical protein
MTPTAEIAVWTDRLRAARAAEQSFLAAAETYYETPTPLGDPWHAEYCRTLGHAERDKADAAARYAEWIEQVLAELHKTRAVEHYSALAAEAAAPAPEAVGA